MSSLKKYAKLYGFYDKLVEDCCKKFRANTRAEVINYIDTLHEREIRRLSSELGFSSYLSENDRRFWLGVSRRYKTFNLNYYV